MLSDNSFMFKAVAVLVIGIILLPSLIAVISLFWFLKPIEPIIFLSLNKRLGESVKT